MYNIKYIPNGGQELIMTWERGYLISTVDGATGHVVDVKTSQGFGQIGNAVQGMSTGGQLITISGKIPYKNTAAKRAMLKAFLPLSSGRLIWEDKYYIDVVVRDSPTISQEKHSSFMLALYAPFPYWRKLAQNYYELGGVEALFSFPINYSTPHKFGYSTSDTQFNAYNGGDSSSEFSLTILVGSSILTNPVITNVNTLRSLKFIGTFSPGDRLDMYRESGQLYIKLNSDTDAFDLLDDTSDMFDLDAGDNVLLFTADSGATETQISITFNEPYVGVLANGV